jgi:hypothetical protein
VRRTGKVRDYQKIPTHRRGKRFEAAAQINDENLGEPMQQVRDFAFEDAVIEGASEEHPRERGIIKRRPGGLTWKSALPVGVLGFAGAASAYFFRRQRQNQKLRANKDWNAGEQ